MRWKENSERDTEAYDADLLDKFIRLKNIKKKINLIIIRNIGKKQFMNHSEGALLR